MRVSGAARTQIERVNCLVDNKCPDQNTTFADPAIAKTQAIACVSGLRLTGEFCFMERAKEPIARAVPGEHAPSTIGAVSRRRQSENQEARHRIAKAGNRLSPVDIVSEGGAFFVCHSGAMPTQSGAAFAGHDPLLNFFHRMHFRILG